jgi:protein-disulfide isomerase
MTTAIAAALALFLSPSLAAPSKDEIKNVLKKNPDILLEVLKDNRKAVFEIINQAAQEEQARRQKEEEEREKKDFEEAFKNPKKPDISAKTRIRGNKDAKYTLVEYSDFQCPYCSRGYQTVEALRKKYGENLRFVYKNLPLSFHPHAMPAAQYYEAAALQSSEKAWQFHDKMFQNQDKLGEAFYKQTAKELGLDVAKLEKDAKSQVVKEKIEADMKEAGEYGFQGTPGFLLNGIPVKGAYPVDFFDSIIARIESKGDAPAKN